jgi:hypothetical protein
LTTLLSKAIKEVEALPPELRDEIARQIIEDIDNELKGRKRLINHRANLKN